MEENEFVKKKQSVSPLLSGENSLESTVFLSAEENQKKEIPSVSQLTRRLRGLLENEFPEVWVKGEISNFRKPVSGHAYFILKDDVAQLRVVMFRPHLMRMKFLIQDGMECIFHGKITVYEARGDYQLLCDLIQPIGMGEMQLALEQLKKKLQQEGLFDPNKKKKLPFLARRIGLVTSPTGAAVKDILKVLLWRFENLEVIIFPTSVQGEKAGEEIVNALQMVELWNQRFLDRKLDLIIVGRGGGSIEDLWCFNEEKVARAIAATSIPTISAVGHEIDFTIADFAADVRAPTPSAAAELAVVCKADVLKLLAHQNTKLRILLSRKIEQKKLHLSHLSRRIVDPRAEIRRMKERIEGKLEMLCQIQIKNLKMMRQKFCGIVEKLHVLSPLLVMGRGYAIVQDEKGGVVSQVEKLQPKDRICISFQKGAVMAEVISATPSFFEKKKFQL